jgi:hypothetical protein
MKNLLLFLLLVSATAVAQKNQFSLTAEGNFNPVTDSYVNQAIPTLVDSQKSSLGGAAEYDHWFTRYQALGVRYEQNPSDGREENGVGAIAIWPQTRSEFLGILTQHLRGNRRGEFQINKFTSFLQEGGGAILTCECSDGNKHFAGWSHSAAFAAGGGTEYSVNERLYIRFSTLIIASATGCYDDPHCRPTTGFSHDVGLGFTWKWGAD